MFKMRVSTPFGFWFWISMLCIFYVISVPFSKFAQESTHHDPLVIYENQQTFRLAADVIVCYMACAVYFVRSVEERYERKMEKLKEKSFDPVI